MNNTVPSDMVGIIADKKKSAIVRYPYEKTTF